MAGRFLLLILLLIPFSARAVDVCATLFAAPAPWRVVSADSGVLRFDPLAFAREWTLLTGNEAELGKVLRLRLASDSAVVNTLRVLVTGGVHGNEPLGVQTALDLVRALQQRPELAAQIQLTLLPTVNFDALVVGWRRAADGTDINREFGNDGYNGSVGSDTANSSTGSRELVRDIKDAIGNDAYDLSLDLHGANTRRDFFVIRSIDDGGLAQKALRSAIDTEFLLKADSGTNSGSVGVRTSKGIDTDRYNLESPGLSTSANQGTLKGYMASRGTLAYTVEYPALLPLETARALNLELALAMIEEAVVRKAAPAR